MHAGEVGTGWVDGDGRGVVDRFTKSVSIRLSTGVEPRPNLNPGRGHRGQSLEEGRCCTGWMETA